MTNHIIQVENLGKRYRIGVRDMAPENLRESIVSALGSSFRYLQQINRPPTEEETLWALRNVSFNVEQGEVLGIIGSNGAGKSTLLKILSRITEPTEGRAIINGRIGSLLEVGTGFHPELTGRENTYLNGAILGMKRHEINRKFDEIVAFAEIEKFIDTPVKRYSSGMYVRLAFAVAAHLEPEVLIIDEVLAVGDTAFQQKCLGKMENVASGGRTVLFVSHNMEALRSLCSRALLISKGQILYEGATDRSIEQYFALTNENILFDVDTTNWPRPDWGADESPLKITRVRLEFPGVQGVLYSGQNIVVNMEVHLFEPVTDLIFGISVYTRGGVRLFECRSADDLGVVSDLSPGVHNIRCSLPENPLNLGSYSLHVGARCAQKRLDFLPNILSFTVDSSKRLESVWLEAVKGPILVKSEWNVASNQLQPIQKVVSDVRID